MSPHFLLDLVLPSFCPGCAAPGRPLCSSCAAALTGPPRAVLPNPPPAGFPTCRAVADYEGPVRSALIAYKERGRRDLLAPLAMALAAAVDAAVTTAPAAQAGPVILVPVPSRAAAVRARGTDTTGRLAAAAGRLLRRCGRPAQAVAALRLSRTTGDSAGLGATARLANLSGAMVADSGRLPPGAAARIVIVDDLVTTGATLAEAARALAVAGRPAVAAAVVAATVRRSRVGLAGGAR